MQVCHRSLMAAEVREISAVLVWLSHVQLGTTECAAQDRFLYTNTEHKQMPSLQQRRRRVERNERCLAKPNIPPVLSTCCRSRRHCHIPFTSWSSWRPSECDPERAAHISTMVYGMDHGVHVARHTVRSSIMVLFSSHPRLSLSRDHAHCLIGTRTHGRGVGCRPVRARLFYVAADPRTVCLRIFLVLATKICWGVNFLTRFYKNRFAKNRPKSTRIQNRSSHRDIRNSLLSTF